jgi:hypothetical protein
VNEEKKREEDRMVKKKAYQQTLQVSRPTSRHSRLVGLPPDTTG